MSKINFNNKNINIQNIKDLLFLTFPINKF